MNFKILEDRLYGEITYIEYFDTYKVTYGDNIYYFPDKDTYREGRKWKAEKFDSYEKCLDFCKEHDIKIVKEYVVKSPFSSGVPDVRAVFPHRNTPYSPDETVDMSGLSENRKNHYHTNKKMARLNEKQRAEITAEILKECQPIIERFINEISSTKFYDAADKADSYYNTELGKHFRQLGDEARERELNTDYETTLNILDEIEQDGVHMYICFYIPTQMKVVVYLNNATQCAIARVRGNEMLNINAPEIISDIAALFNNRKPVSGNAVKSIGMALKKSKQIAQDAANKINAAFGSNISWRYLYGDRTSKSGNTTEGNYQLLGHGAVKGTGIKYAVTQYVPIRPDYSIYYVFVGTAETSFMMYVKTVEKDVYIRGAKQMLTPYRVIKKNADITNCPAPTTESSDIARIWEFFKNGDKDARLVLSAINQSIDTTNITIKDVETGFKAIYKFDDTAAEVSKVQDAADFMDF